MDTSLLSGYTHKKDAQVAIWYVDTDRQFALEADETIETGLSEYRWLFHLPDAFDSIQVVIVPSRSEFDRLVRDLLHVDIEYPSNPARIAQPQRRDIVVISPSRYEQEKIYQYDRDSFGRLLRHELIHVIEEYLSPNIDATPRWWSEGLAVCFSQQCRFEADFYQPALDGIANGSIPSLAQIDLERKLAYEWGWTIVEYIKQTYGLDGINRIIRESSNGEIASLIGLDIKNFEKNWQEWLICNKSLPQSPPRR